MPPLSMHLALARDTYRSIQSSRLDAETGTYLLGATAPDIRVILRCDRSITHFFDMYHYGEQDSVRGLFESNPKLRNIHAVNLPTAAFLSGYLTHLVMDEEWINSIYRPYFGIQSTLGGDERANLMDRILQYELDRRTRVDREVVEVTRQRILEAATNLEIEFLEMESLERWREVTLDLVSHPPDWERFRFVASRHLVGAGVESPETLDEFMAKVPEILTETINHVSDERLSAYMEAATRRAVETVRGYLN